MKSKNYKHELNQIYFGHLAVEDTYTSGHNCSGYATIPISWNETKHTLEIGKRSDEFSRMLKEHTFNIVWVSKNDGAGVSTTEKPDAVVHYNGKAVEVKIDK